MTSKQFNAILEDMEQLNQHVSDEVPPLPFSSKQMFIILLLVTMLSGLSGYLIGVRKDKSTNSKLASQPIPTIISPIPTTVPTVPPVTLYPTPTLDPATVNWQTYTDAKYGFSFKYPLYWKFNSNFDPYGGMNPFILDINTANASHNPLRMAISIEENDSNWKLNQWFAVIQTRTGQTLSQQQVFLGGYPAIKTVTPAHLEDYYLLAPSLRVSTPTAQYVIFFTSDGEGMDNPYPDTDPFVQQELTNFHRVLSSFRFPNRYDNKVDNSRPFIYQML